MRWLIGPILAVVFLFFMGFRKTAGALLAAALIGAGVVYQLDDVNEQQTTARVKSQISLKNVSVMRSFDSTYELTGMISNQSAQYRIDGITLAVRLHDCRSADRSDCEVIGEAATHVGVSVPPRQTRKLVATFYFAKDTRQPKGTLVWNHEITSIRAMQP
jgi:hypothetical protein